MIVYLISIGIYLQSFLKGSFFDTIISERSSAGRAQPCQGWGREFESRLSLKAFKEKAFLFKGCPDGGIGRHAGLKILCPLGRVGSSPTPGTKNRGS